jgi:DNA (cytosine-5)-methyltransferase 1
LNCVELFAGAGGAALGLEAAGFSHLACIEYDPSACETLRTAGLPCVEGDVRDPDLYEPEWVGCDLLWASFPCQAWSTAGKREGAKDERNGWSWTVDAIDCLEPEWFAAENVTGLLTHRGGCASRCLGPNECPRAYFDNVILAQLRERFAWVGFRVLNASGFGVPQHRRRVIIVAGPQAIEWPEPTHGKPSGQDDLFGRSLLPWVTVGKALGIEGFVRTEMSGGVPVPADSPSSTVPGSGTQYHHEIDPGVRATNTICPSSGRRLTVEECAILQDFPAGHPFQGTKTARYRQVGNAVPPKLAEVVGRAILAASR